MSRTRQTHAEILAEDKVIRCLGKLDGYAIYVAKYNYMPPKNGVTSRTNGITAELWSGIVKEMNGPDRKYHDSVFIDEYQARSLLEWAEDKLVPWSDASKEKPCEDCADGWYVGVIERYPCPTCNGTKRVPI